MIMRNLPLNTWMVVDQFASARGGALVSKHDTQHAAEAECCRRNKAAHDCRYRACILLEPIAQRMGGQPAPTAWKRRSG